MDIIRKVLSLVNDRFMALQSEIDDLKIGESELNMKANRLEGALMAQTPRQESVTSFKVYPYFDTTGATASFDSSKVRVNNGKVYVGGVAYTEGNASWADKISQSTEKFYDVTPTLSNPAQATDVQYVFVGVNHDDQEYCVIASNEAPEDYTGVASGVSTYDIVPLCKFLFDGTTFLRKDIQVKHEGDIVLGSSGAQACPRWRVSVDNSGNVYCTAGTWKVDGVCYDYSPGAGVKVDAINAVGFTANTGATSAGTNYVVAYWGSPSYATEPIIDPSNWTLRVGVTTSLSGIGRSCDRNLMRLAKITVAGSVTTVEQLHCEDIETHAISTNEDVESWVVSGYYTWAGLTAQTPTRALLQYNAVATHPETTSRQLANEHKMADTSWNLFFAQATSYTSDAEAQGPDATGHWCGVDTDYVSCTKSDKSQKTLDIEIDSAQVGAPYSPLYTIGLYGINDIPTGSSQVGKYAAYFKNDGAVDTGSKPKGELNYAAFDESRTGDVPTHKSLKVTANGGFIEVYGFQDSDKWAVPYASDLPANNKELLWFHPIKTANDLDTPLPNLGVAPTSFWNDVLLNVSFSGTTMSWSAHGDISWLGPGWLFKRDTAAAGSWDPITEWGGSGGGGSFCADVYGCVGSGGTNQLDHDVDLLDDTPGEGNQVNAKGHHGTYWANESNPLVAGDAQSYHTNGEVHADDFKLHDAPLTNFWNLEQFLVQSNGTAEVSGTGLTFYAATGTLYMEAATGDVDINATSANVDINAAGTIVCASGAGQNAQFYQNTIANGLHIGSYTDLSHTNDVRITSVSSYINLDPNGALQINGTDGAGITNWFTKGILTGGSIIEIDAVDLKSTDKILVLR